MVERGFGVFAVCFVAFASAVGTLWGGSGRFWALCCVVYLFGFVFLLLWEGCGAVVVRVWVVVGRVS